MERFVQQVLPVIVSIVIIIAIALLRNSSRTLAAALAVFPINMSLALWVVYAGSAGDRSIVTGFVAMLVPALLCTLGFALTVWWASRAGWTLVPMLLTGYAVWIALFWLITALRGTAAR